MEKIPVKPNFDAFDALINRLLNDPNFTVKAVALAVALIIFTFVLLKIFSSGSAAAKNILILGLSDSGKTTLWSQLLEHLTINAMTSMQPNEGVLRVGKRSYSLVDLPGYDRLRIKFFDDFKGTGRGIIFVIDSLQFLSNMRDVADFLYTVMSDPVVLKMKIPILIACNKQDLGKSKSCHVIQKSLEKEMGLIRETRVAALTSTDDGHEENKVLGKIDKDFNWGDIKNPLNFCDCSSLDDDQIEKVGTWLFRL